MALPAAGVWEVRPTNGSDNNGGGFRAGGTGTDFSQQNAAQVAYTDLAFDGTNQNKCTSAAHPFDSTHVHNYINITGGTGATTDIYEVTAVVAGVATLDHNWHSAGAATSDGTGNLGGALKTLGKLASVMVASNKAFCKAETHANITASTTFGAAGVTPSSTVPANQLIGYTTTRGDNGRVTLTCATNTGIKCLNFTNGGWWIQGFDINCASLGTSTGIFLNGPNCIVRNCKVANFTTAGIDSWNGSNPSQNLIRHCEVTGGTSAATAAIIVYNFNTVEENYVHDNACIGIKNPSSSVNGITRNVITNNTGSSNDGIQITGSVGSIRSNVIWGNGRHGIFINVTNPMPFPIANNIIGNHTAAGAAGLKQVTAAWPADPRYDGNFYYNNSTNRVNMDDTTTNAVDGVNPYTNTLDVSLTADPFTNSAGNDWTLNNTAGGGAAVRGKGYPGVGGTVFSGIPGLTTSGFLDGGVFQHQDPLQPRSLILPASGIL